MRDNMTEIASIIKYEGDNQTFIWKHPQEDFFSGSQLIVHESQEAVFFMNGQALDSFGPGRYTLETQNMPVVSRFFNRVTGDVSPFHCELYFINKTEQMAVKWGTDSKMEYVEPTYGFPIQIGACGEMNLRLEDGRKLLMKVVGTENVLTQTQFVQKIRAFLMTKVKPYTVTLIRENRLNIFQTDEQLQAISETLQNILKDDFAEYGVSLEKFFVISISKPEGDKNYQRFKELHFRQYADIAEAELRQKVGIIEQQTAARRMVIEAEGIAQKRNIEGNTYKDERSFDVAEHAASNQGVGQFSNLGIGMGMISGIGGSIGSTVGGMMNHAMNPAEEERKCTKCGNRMNADAKFCPQCGEKTAPAAAEKNEKRPFGMKGEGQQNGVAAMPFPRGAKTSNRRGNSGTRTFHIRSAFLFFQRFGKMFTRESEHRSGYFSPSDGYIVSRRSNIASIAVCTSFKPPLAENL